MVSDFGSSSESRDFKIDLSSDPTRAILSRMNFLRVLIKASVVLSTVVAYLGLAILIDFLIRGPDQSRRLRNRVLQPMSGFCLKWMDIRLKVINAPKPGQNYLFVGNHVGFLDIFIAATALQTSFITSVDLRETLGLGWIARAAGCLFVERRSHSNIQNEIGKIREVLQRGHSVVLYPEAKATDGAKIYPFKKSLMTSVVGTQAQILPMVLNYRTVNGEPMSHKWRDTVSWWGDRSFAHCFYESLSVSQIEAELEFLTPIVCTSEEQRREVAVLAQGQVENKYFPIPWPNS